MTDTFELHRDMADKVRVRLITVSESHTTKAGAS